MNVIFIHIEADDEDGNRDTSPCDVRCPACEQDWVTFDEDGGAEVNTALTCRHLRFIPASQELGIPEQYFNGMTAERLLAEVKANILRLCPDGGHGQDYAEILEEFLYDQEFMESAEIADVDTLVCYKVPLGPVHTWATIYGAKLDG